MTCSPGGLRVRAMLLLCAVLAGGCAGVVSVPSEPSIAPPAERQALGWWAARFRMDWPEQEDPDFYLDVLLAHRVIAPVLLAHRPQLRYWRFHRRAAQDAAGHQFSFLFYADAATAQVVLGEVRSSPDLPALRASGILAAEIYSDPSRLTRPGVGDTSDPSWPEEVQRTWPYFIMGVSEFWLALILEYARERPLPPGWHSVGALEDYYRDLSGRLDEVWRDTGGHALLHHLNALFGYEPVVIYERQLRTF